MFRPHLRLTPISARRTPSARPGCGFNRGVTLDGKVRVLSNAYQRRTRRSSWAFMIRGTSRGSFRTRTTSPASTATVRTGPDGDSDIGRDQRRCVVHPIANHGHALPVLLQFLNLRRLLVGEDLRKDRVDAKLPRYGPRYRTGGSRTWRRNAVNGRRGRVAMGGSEARGKAHGSRYPTPLYAANRPPWKLLSIRSSTLAPS